MVRRLIIPAALVLMTNLPAPAAEMVFYQLPPAYPHDVAPAPDGTVWFSGQRQGFAGRFDPKTGRLDKIALGPGAAPHGVIVGPDGNAWLTEGGQNAIARVDAKSGAVKLFPLPKQFSYANLNTLTFDRNGIVWFTGQSGIYGRANAVTGKVDAWQAPRGAGPYGIATTPAGEVWYASLAGDYIARIDTATGAVSVVDPPRKGVGPRRIWSDSKGVLWVSFWHAGRSAVMIPRRGRGRPIPCRAASPAPIRSMWMTRTGCGRPTGSPTRSSASSRRARPTPPFPATSGARMCARWRGVPARYGAGSRVPTAWS